MKNPIRAYAESQMEKYEGYELKINYPVLFLRMIVMPPFILAQNILEFLNTLNENIGDKIDEIAGNPITYEKINK